MKIVTLFYGSIEQRRAYAPLLQRWVQHHRNLGLGDKLLIVTRSDEHVSFIQHMEHGESLPILALDLSAYTDVIRPEQPFDIKGALMCEALRALGPFLLIDNDAFLTCDPAPLLENNVQLEGALIVMPRDIGAINAGFTAALDAPFAGVLKLCAGVVWFGDIAAHRRLQLVRAYLAAWRDLSNAFAEGHTPWQPHLSRLMEQYAWSLAAHRLGCLDQLGDTWNWPPHLEAFGENPGAIVNHEFGRKKWKTLGRRAPLNT